jgi:hypothetical protein
MRQRSVSEMPLIMRSRSSNNTTLLVIASVSEAISTFRPDCGIASPANERSRNDKPVTARIMQYLIEILR